MTDSSTDSAPRGQGVAIHINDLAVGFDRQTVLQIDDLQIAAGEFVAVVGPSGCGKSTLLRAIAGLLAPVHGSLTVAAEDVSHPARTGFVFQEATLLPWRTAHGNICLPAEIERQPIDPQHVRQLADMVGLTASDLRKRPAELSGGMKMRVSLARALALTPSLLLLDEPFAAVDDLLRLQLQEDLRRIHQELRLTTMIVTHNISEAVRLGDRVVTLNGSPAAVTHITPIKLDRTGDVLTRPEFSSAVAQVYASLKAGTTGGAT